jgi:hypothetical protein
VCTETFILDDFGFGRRNSMSVLGHPRLLLQ